MWSIALGSYAKGNKEQAYHWLGTRRASDRRPHDPNSRPRRHARPRLHRRRLVRGVDERAELDARAAAQCQAHADELAASSPGADHDPNASPTSCTSCCTRRTRSPTSSPSEEGALDRWRRGMTATPSTAHRRSRTSSTRWRCRDHLAGADQRRADRQRPRQRPTTTATSARSGSTRTCAASVRSPGCTSY